MASKSSRIRNVVAAKEVTRGTNAGIAQFTGIEFENGFQTTTPADEITRDPLKKTFSPVGTKLAGLLYNLTGTLNFKPGGFEADAVVKPECSDLLEACGMKLLNGYVLTLTNVVGTFERFEDLTNSTAVEAVGGKLYKVSPTQLFIHDVVNVPSAGDELTGDTSGATATVSATAPEKSLVYKVVTPDEDIATVCMRDNASNLLRESLYTRGNVKFNFKVKDMLKLEFTFTGIYLEPIETPIADVVFSTQEPPLCHPATLVIGDMPVSDTEITMLSLDLGNEVTPIPNIQANDGVSSVRITNRAPTGTVDPTVLPLGDFDPFALAKASAKIPISITINEAGAAGTRVQLDMPESQLKMPETGDRDGLLAYTLNFTPTDQQVGDTEIYLTVY